jgi:hypothetical protein
MQEYASALGQRRIQFVQDLFHLLHGFRQAVIADGLADVDHGIARIGPGQQLLVGIEFAQLSQVDEAVDTRVEQAPNALKRRLLVSPRRVFTREQALRHDPIAVWQWRRL